ncbi:hypothetical protein K443DRAFT_10779 [Laccaria amethystina LaAM-08-1]|uniref:Uncharacterized protein n=1 Tax=Laccaria amethystina LaAM-08-1 TaxID=1095629 RepID=A0A0C9XJ26_9AGAR|nr:hypothetical protein K443DRAFT_10779 [Laccaria amethystina LaAM-08-1]
MARTSSTESYSTANHFENSDTLAQGQLQEIISLLKERLQHQALRQALTPNVTTPQPGFATVQQYLALMRPTSKQKPTRSSVVTASVGFSTKVETVLIPLWMLRYFRNFHHIDGTLGYSFATLTQQVKFQTYTSKLQSWSQFFTTTVSSSKRFPLKQALTFSSIPVITLDIEVDLIWKKKWSAVNVFFIISGFQNQYFGEAPPVYV